MYFQKLQITVTLINNIEKTFLTFFEISLLKFKYSTTVIIKTLK